MYWTVGAGDSVVELLEVVLLRVEAVSFNSRGKRDILRDARNAKRWR